MPSDQSPPHCVTRLGQSTRALTSSEERVREISLSILNQRGVSTLYWDTCLRDMRTHLRIYCAQEKGECLMGGEGAKKLPGKSEERNFALSYERKRSEGWVRHSALEARKGKGGMEGVGKRQVVSMCVCVCVCVANFQY